MFTLATFLNETENSPLYARCSSHIEISRSNVFSFIERTWLQY